ncbi:hypothetical protein AOCH_005983 [Aspergillus ochraceoroseus]|uniref:N(6)-L-threonylcarbamoyladenine synthase n=2 Tax=Aspergillus ochraceoroseus TaxID=138278 RepID=A0A0F8UZI5_9EURO|nr:hypothetical protein AOCH_005983 [Aspergillus ochraceoroseus]
MYRARPQLSLNIVPMQTSSRPALSLKSPGLPRTPISPSPASPAAKRFSSSIQVPSYNYVNSCSSKSILKKHAASAPGTQKRIQFQGTPIVHCITPIENTDELVARAFILPPNFGFTLLVLQTFQGDITSHVDAWIFILMIILRVASTASRKTLGTSAQWSVVARRRGLLTLAIETSCDDTCVAIVDKNQSGATRIHFLENITSDSTAYQGIHPVRALESHQENLANLVNKALPYLPRASECNNEAREIIALSDGNRQRPDFISVTRGPGMRSNLFVGLDTAKALSVAWQIPFVGVHHMQAHLLTPRLVSALSPDPQTTTSITPEFPFLSILASGGHSLLVRSSSLTDHEILASTADVAIGESLDKVAREILPQSLLQTAKTTMYGPLLEQYAFPNGPADYADYTAPRTRGDELRKRVSPWGWSLTTPFARTRQLAFSFASLPTAVSQILSRKAQAHQPLADDERVALAREAMRTCFEHLASRTVIALESLAPSESAPPVRTLVVSGGVAANRFLMALLRSFLDVRGFGHVGLVAPPPALCTDNAAMIGWAGIEMFEAGWRSELACRALRKWSLDPRADDGGGVLGVTGWGRVV